ncbi:Rme1 protein [Saccharomycopsis crataegensis]|uniref:Rme1 protein n=1 Tax=Saccharomycopsis crataegensis TaxID=43959 RepID=A0AAV5QSV6_9ASCO|nr:Rme1 protein [Saccharomycopsis crataegensis]
MSSSANYNNFDLLEELRNNKLPFNDVQDHSITSWAWQNHHHNHSILGYPELSNNNNNNLSLSAPTMLGPPDQASPNLCTNDLAYAQRLLQIGNYLPPASEIPSDPYQVFHSSQAAGFVTTASEVSTGFFMDGSPTTSPSSPMYSPSSTESRPTSSGEINASADTASSGNSSRRGSIASIIKNDAEMWEYVTEKCKKKGSYKCSHCPQSFHSLEYLIYHIDQYDLSHTRPHKCVIETCIWRYIGLPRRAELRRHMQALHGIKWDTDFRLLKNEQGNNTYNDGGTNLACSEKSKEVLAALDGMVDPFNEGSFAEDIESEATTTTKQRNTPMYHCTVIRPYCEKSFPRKDSLQRHIRLCHTNPSSRFNKKLGKSRRMFG